jgi:putative hydroxymethylpyrimidine transport system permease protein
MLNRPWCSRFVRGLIILAGLLSLWQGLVWLTGVPPYILPSPIRVIQALVNNAGLIGRHLGVTLAEILAGLICGTVLGVSAALVVGYFRPARRWLMPVLVASQAIPVFAIAPLLVLWLGYGMASKVAMATLIIFFPVTAAFLDGLRRTEPGWVDLARTMTASVGGAPPEGHRLRILLYIRTPAALPALASGLRVAAAVAPIGAVVGEWVGSSAGLGYLMLHANGRMQVDLMFAALVALSAVSLTLWFTLDAVLRRMLPWQPDLFSEPQHTRAL